MVKSTYSNTLGVAPESPGPHLFLHTAATVCNSVIVLCWHLDITRCEPDFVIDILLGSMNFLWRCMAVLKSIQVNQELNSGSIYTSRTDPTNKITSGLWVRIKNKNGWLTEKGMPVGIQHPTPMNAVAAAASVPLSFTSTNAL